MSLGKALNVQEVKRCNVAVWYMVTPGNSLPVKGSYVAWQAAHLIHAKHRATLPHTSAYVLQRVEAGIVYTEAHEGLLLLLLQLLLQYCAGMCVPLGKKSRHD